MADTFNVLSFILDEDLAALKRDAMSHAAGARLLGGSEHEDTVLQLTLEVDLRAVLRAQTSCRTVRQVQQAEGQEDHQPAEEARQ